MVPMAVSKFMGDPHIHDPNYKKRSHNNENNFENSHNQNAETNQTRKFCISQANIGNCAELV